MDRKRTRYRHAAQSDSAVHFMKWCSGEVSGSGAIQYLVYTFKIQGLPKITKS